MKVSFSGFHRNVPRIATACSVLVGAMLSFSVLFAAAGAIWFQLLAGVLGFFPFFLVRLTLTKWNEVDARSARINAARDRTESREQTGPRKRQLAPVPIQEKNDVNSNEPKLRNSLVRMRVNTAHGWVIKEVEVFEPHKTKSTVVPFEVGAQMKACVESDALTAEQPVPAVQPINSYPCIESPLDTELPSISAVELPLVQPSFLTTDSTLLQFSRSTFVRRRVETAQGWVIKKVELLVPHEAETAVPPSHTARPTQEVFPVVGLHPAQLVVSATDVALLLASLRAVMRKKLETTHTWNIEGVGVFEPFEVATKALPSITSLTVPSSVVDTGAALPQSPKKSLVRRRVDTAQGWVIKDVEVPEKSADLTSETSRTVAFGIEAIGGPLIKTLSKTLVRRRVETAHGWVIRDVEVLEPLELHATEAASAKSSFSDGQVLVLSRPTNGALNEKNFEPDNWFGLADGVNKNTFHTESLGTNPEVHTTFPHVQSNRVSTSPAEPQLQASDGLSTCVAPIETLSVDRVPSFFPSQSEFTQGALTQFEAGTSACPVALSEAGVEALVDPWTFGDDSAGLPQKDAPLRDSLPGSLPTAFFVPNNEKPQVSLSTTNGKKASRNAEREPPPFRLDLARIAKVQAETGRVDSFLAGIFNAEASLPQQASAVTFVNESATERNVLGLDGAHSALIHKMLSRPHWSREELRVFAGTLDLMLDGALECVNEAAFDIHEVPFFEGDDPIEVNPNIVDLLNQ